MCGAATAAAVRARVLQMDSKAQRLSLSLKPSNLQEASAAEVQGHAGAAVLANSGESDLDEEMAELAEAGESSQYSSCAGMCIALGPKSSLAPDTSGVACLCAYVMAKWQWSRGCTLSIISFPLVPYCTGCLKFFGVYRRG